MKIRLVIPECRDWCRDWYSRDSHDIDRRVEMLRHTILKNDGVDLVITSHNFFRFSAKYSSFAARAFIEKNIIPTLNKKIEDKKPLILGFDLSTSSKECSRSKKGKVKGKTKGSIADGGLNPYRGIDAVVCYIKVKNKSYMYGTHIWECWREKNVCDFEGIEEQNEKRVFSLRGKTIGLLSCGDIAHYCHNDGNLLPKVDIYVDLSHKSLRGWTSQCRTSPKLIEEWKRCKYVFVTQQVQDVLRYVREGEYPYIFPKRTKHVIKELSMDGKRMGVIVDVGIQN